MTTVVSRRDALRAEQRGERLAVDVVALHRVVEVGVPVDLDRAGDVAGLVEQDVLVGLDDDEAGRRRGARRATRCETSRSGCAYSANFGADRGRRSCVPPGVAPEIGRE